MLDELRGLHHIIVISKIFVSLFPNNVPSILTALSLTFPLLPGTNGVVAYVTGLFTTGKELAKSKMNNFTACSGGCGTLPGMATGVGHIPLFLTPVRPPPPGSG